MRINVINDNEDFDFALNLKATYHIFPKTANRFYKSAGIVLRLYAINLVILFLRL